MCCCVLGNTLSLWWGVGGPSHEKVRMLIGKFELTPQRRPIWVWLKFYLTLKRHHLKQNRLDYQPLFRK